MSCQHFKNYILFMNNRCNNCLCVITSLNTISLFNMLVTIFIHSYILVCFQSNNLYAFVCYSRILIYTFELMCQYMYLCVYNNLGIFSDNSTC